MKRTLIVLAVIVLLAGAAWVWFTSRAHIDHLGTVEVPPNITWLDVGLTEKEREIWHHLSEGSELMPMSFLEALQHTNSGKSFIEALATYGFLVESEDPHRLPIGWTVQTRQIGDHKVPFVGINCAACHTGEIRYKGQTLRIDGAPNLFALEQFFLDMKVCGEVMQGEPLNGFLFVREVIRRNHDSKHAGELLETSDEGVALLDSVRVADGLSNDEKEIVNTVGAAFDDAVQHKTNDLESYPGLATNTPGLTTDQKQRHGVMRQLVSGFRKDAQFIERRLASFETLSKAIDSGVDLGPGRGDSFGIIRNLLFPSEVIALDAPVSTPALFDFQNFTWVHWDGNSTSVMDRNIAQAIALGADFDPVTAKSSVLPFNLDKLEKIASKITAPAWPEKVLGRLDRAKANRGKVHFTKHCAECHTTENLCDIDKVGTSPHRALNFADKLSGLPFVTHLETVVARARTQLCSENGITETQVRAMERKADPAWRATHGYIARPLKGIWATAPFLHNGSVPTLYHLLQPAAQRPVTFRVGSREFDPMHVGYLSDVSLPGWLLDTTIKGNENSGHEFGTSLAETDRLDLVEFLKTL
jgi:hypothetical protein